MLQIRDSIPEDPEKLLDKFETDEGAVLCGEPEVREGPTSATWIRQPQLDAN